MKDSAPSRPGTTARSVERASLQHPALGVVDVVLQHEGAGIDAPDRRPQVGELEARDHGEHDVDRLARFTALPEAPLALVERHAPPELFDDHAAERLALAAHDGDAGVLLDARDEEVDRLRGRDV